MVFTTLVMELMFNIFCMKSLPTVKAVIAAIVEMSVCEFSPYSRCLNNYLSHLVMGALLFVSLNTDGS